MSVVYLRIQNKKFNLKRVSFLPCFVDTKPDILKQTRISNLVSMTSDVKLSHYFLLIKVINRDLFLTLKLFRKQFQSTTCFYFNLNVLKFELQYE